MTFLAALAAALALAPGNAAGNYTAARSACYGVFGSRGGECLRVAGCETGYTYSVYARNGQYLGLMQVSAYWRRAVAGFAFDAWSQIRHGYRVFVRSGYSWHPWECRP